MTVLPLLFILLPLIQVFHTYAHVHTSNLNLHVGALDAVLAGDPGVHAVHLVGVLGGRRARAGTLEAVLITPIRREEFLIAKALAAFVPTLGIAYLVFGIFLAASALFANPVIAAAIFSGTHVLIQLLFTPLLAGWGIWVGIAVSARSTDVRSAQQLSVLGTLPLLATLALISLNVIAVSASSRSGSPRSCWPSTCSHGGQ